MISNLQMKKWGFIELKWFAQGNTLGSGQAEPKSLLPTSLKFLHFVLHHFGFPQRITGTSSVMDGLGVGGGERMWWPVNFMLVRYTRGHTDISLPAITPLVISSGHSFKYHVYFRDSKLLFQCRTLFSTYPVPSSGAFSLSLLSLLPAPSRL